MKEKDIQMLNQIWNGVQKCEVLIYNIKAFVRF